MASTMSTISRIYSVSSYDGDMDDDSFISAQSNNHVDFRLMHTKVSQVYSHPLLPHSPVSRPASPHSYKSFQTYSSHQTNASPESQSSQIPRKATSIVVDEESMATAELLSEDGNSQYSEPSNSSNDLLSLDTAMESHASFVFNDESGTLDVLSSFSFFAPSSPNTHSKGAGRFDILSSLPFFSSQTYESNTCDNYGSSESSSSKKNSENSSYITPVLDSNVSLSLSASDEFDSRKLNNSKRLQGSMTKTYASTQTSSNFPSDSTINSSMESQNALNLSEATSEETNSKVLTTNRPSLRPPCTSFLSRQGTSSPSSANPTPTPGNVPTTVKCTSLQPKINNQRQSASKSIILSSILSGDSELGPISSIASEKSPVIPSFHKQKSSLIPHKLSTTSSSDALQKFPVSKTHKPIPTYSPKATQAFIRAHTVEPLYDDMNNSPYKARVDIIKKKLRSMEIQHYRQKCLRSLRKSLAHYEKVKATGDYDESSTCSMTCSELSIQKQSHDIENTSASRVITGVVREIICFKVVISVTCIVFVLYKDSLSRALQGGGQNTTNHEPTIEDWL